MTTATATAATSSARPRRTLSTRDGRTLWLGLVVLVAVLVVVSIASITLGSRSITLATVMDAFTNFDPDSTPQTVVREMRVPRTLLGLIVGAALGLSGALLQGVTRNPLADPGIMGINAGAAAFVVMGISVLGVRDVGGYVWLALLGAAFATVMVYSVASLGREGATPVKLALAGASVTAGLSSITTGIVMTDLEALNEMRFWQVGSLAGRYMPIFWQVMPFILIGLALALAIGRSLNGLALGEDTALALGQRVGLTRGIVFLTVTILCGAGTAACGPIVFVGLVVPHIARAMCGPDYRWILPYALLITPAIFLAADILGRLILSPGELEVGVVLGVLGAPAFVALVRYRNLAEL